MSNLSQLFDAEEKVRRWRAEFENASARLELATIRKNIKYLISQHEPVASTGLDRKQVERILGYVEHGDMKRFIREGEENG